MKITILIGLVFLSSFGISQESKDSTFQFCPDLPIWPYYRFVNLNEQSFSEICTYFRKDYPFSEMQLVPNNNGIITIQFKINCHGEVGNFDAFSCDLSYVENAINPKLLDYFLQKTKDLGGWKNVIDAHGVVANTHKFYSFRIVNGELTEILPK